MEIPEEKGPITEVVASHPTLGKIVLKPKTISESAVSNAIAKFNVEKDTAIALREFFEPLERQAAEWSEKAFQLVITDVSQTDEIAKAKEARLSVRAIRLSIEKLHKEKKEDSLRKGQVLDLIKRTLVDLVEPIEKHLKKQEDFVELQERKRIDELYKSRLTELEPYRVPGDNIDVLALGEMSEVVFNGIKTGVIAAHQQREQEKADQEKAAMEKEENDRKERLAAENDRLRQNARMMHLMSLGFFWSEQDSSFIRGPKDKHAMNVGPSDLVKWSDEEFETVTKKFRELIDIEIKEDEAEQQRLKKLAEQMNEDQKRYTQRIQSLTTIGFVWNESGNSMEHLGIFYGFKKERIEKMPDSEFDPLFDDISARAAKWRKTQEDIRQKNERAAQELADREKKAAIEKKERELAEKKAARAPDKTKLLALAEAIKNIEQPELKTEDGKAVLLNVQALLSKVHKYINEQCANL